MIIKMYEENPNPRHVRRVVDILERGGVIIYPTDTVYGLGCDIHNRQAVERVAQLKGDRIEKANYSFIVSDLSHLSDYASRVDNETFKLMKSYLPGPYTFILRASRNVPRLFRNRKKTVGIRIPDNQIILSIVRELGRPILTTSVKAGDELLEYTTDPELIHEEYKDKVDLVIHGGYGNNVPSTVIDCTVEPPLVLREGMGKI